MLQLATTALITLPLFFLISVFVSRQRRPTHNPPGPQADVLIGHARKIPLTDAWEVYGKWAKLYGDVIHLHSLGHNILVLNSVKAAKDLLEKKSASFSDRPYVPLIYLMGWEPTLPMLRYGDRFKRHRRMMQRQLGPQAISSLRPVQETHVTRFMVNLMDKPDDFLQHIHRLIAGVMIHITYGHDVLNDDDELAVNVEKAMQMTSSAGSVGTTLLDLIPPLCLVPAWVPGMHLKRLALQIARLVKTVIDEPYNEIVTKKSAGVETSGIVANVLDEAGDIESLSDEDKDDIKYFGGAVYNAGTDTTKSTLYAFFLFMTLNPDVAKKAQEEIDAVVGEGHLPTLSDRRSLPYIDCIIKEVFRVHPPIPLGVPHSSIQPESYRGWDIPTETLAITNIWQMMNDETYFPQPDIFRPERHANKAEMSLDGIASLDAEGFVEDNQTIGNDPSSLVFGFGRRACPGKYLVDATLWLTIASVLAVYDITIYKDPITGQDQVPVFEREGNIVIYPKPFKCTVKPRSEKHKQLVTEMARYA